MTAGGVDDGKNCDRIVFTLFLSVCEVDNWDLGSFGTLLSSGKKKVLNIYYTLQLKNVIQLLWDILTFINYITVTVCCYGTLGRWYR